MDAALAAIVAAPEPAAPAGVLSLLLADFLGCVRASADMPSGSFAEDGVAGVGVLDPQGATLTELDTGAVSASLTGRGDRVVALLGYADRPEELRVLDLTGGQSRLLRAASDRVLPSGLVSEATGSLSPLPEDWTFREGTLEVR